MPKWVALTVRKLKPGAYDDWRQAWEPEQMPPGIRAYICRSRNDPDEIVAFGIIEASREEIEGMHEASGDEEARVARMAPSVDHVLADGTYEVIEEVTG